MLQELALKIDQVDLYGQCTYLTLGQSIVNFVAPAETANHQLMHVLEFLMQEYFCIKSGKLKRQIYYSLIYYFHTYEKRFSLILSIQRKHFLEGMISGTIEGVHFLQFYFQLNLLRMTMFAESVHFNVPLNNYY